MCLNAHGYTKKISRWVIIGVEASDMDMAKVFGSV